ncbi:MAG TPA: DUF5522 domain-containing protein [Terriglobales bacterium]|nr:DUF5522 domain-containing protein [Terriglobales bacterium]
MPEDPKPVPPPVNPVEGEDYYWDGPFMVFTEAYHLKRGYCCNSGCRHCPYESNEVSKDLGNATKG